MEFTSPIPEITWPDGEREIACAEWCANCNAYTMTVIFRDGSAYRPLKKNVVSHLPHIHIPKEIIDAIINPKRNICTCGEDTWIWNRKESLCQNCDDREQDFEYGHYYRGYGTLPIETKYDEFGKI